jgi:hypothetical protein
MGEAAARARYAEMLMSLNKVELVQHAHDMGVEVRTSTRMNKPALRAMLLASKEHAEEHTAKVCARLCLLRVLPSSRLLTRRRRGCSTQRAKHDGAGPSGTQ